MSHSLNKIFQKFAAYPKHRIGISIGRQAIWVARVAVRGAEQTVDWIESASLSTPIFQGVPKDSTEQEITTAAQNLFTAQKIDLIPAYIALPDPAVSMSVIQLDRLPTNRKLREKLVRWQIAKELGADPDTLACTQQYIGRENDKYLLLGLVVNKRWLQCLQQALSKAAIAVSRVDMHASYRFNQFYDLCTSDNEGGASIFVHPDYWTLSIWDAGRRLRFVRSQWMQQNNGAESAVSNEEIGREVEHLIRAYTTEGTDRTINRIYISGDSLKVKQFESLLDRRMRKTCTMLPSDHGFATTLPGDGQYAISPSPALSATVR